MEPINKYGDYIIGDVDKKFTKFINYNYNSLNDNEDDMDDVINNYIKENKQKRIKKDSKYHLNNILNLFNKNKKLN